MFPREIERIDRGDHDVAAAVRHKCRLLEFADVGEALIAGLPSTPC